MADDAHSKFAEFIARLCLEAGRIMEDVSPAMAMRLPETADGIDARITAARQAGEDMPRSRWPPRFSPGEQPAIIERHVWDEVQATLARTSKASVRAPARSHRACSPD